MFVDVFHCRHSVRDFTRTVREMRRTVSDEVREITQTLEDMKIGFNRKKHNATKVVCPNCNAKVRRDGLKTHRTSSKCARKARKYNKKKHDGQLKACPLCKVEVVWGKMKRHQSSVRCLNALCAVASGSRATSQVRTCRRGNTVFHFSERLSYASRIAFPPFFSCGKPFPFVKRSSLLFSSTTT